MAAIYGFLGRIIGYVMAFIYGLVKNYGLSIIILTTLMRLILLPVYAKQMKYTSKMGKLQPKVKDIQTRYARDKQMMNQKLAELYAQEGVNPSSGCLPLLIQLPIIMGLFTLLRSPLSYMSEDMIMAVHESFLWIGDLCQPDAWILPILAGVSTYFTYKATAASGDAAGMMNGMKYFFPIMIFLMGRTFPAGLALYWAIGNVFTIVQNVVFNKNVKYDSIRTEAREEVDKKRKKSK